MTTHDTDPVQLRPSSLMTEPPGCTIGSCAGLDTLRWQFDRYRGDLAELLAATEGHIVRQLASLIASSHESHRHTIAEEIRVALAEQRDSDRPSVTVNVEAVRRKSEFAGRLRGWREIGIVVGGCIGSAITTYLAMR